MKCEECIYFGYTNVKAPLMTFKRDQGECRIKLPYEVDAGGLPWPIVHKDDWCGEYKSKETTTAKFCTKSSFCVQAMGSIMVRDKRIKALEADHGMIREEIIEDMPEVSEIGGLLKDYALTNDLIPGPLLIFAAEHIKECEDVLDRFLLIKVKCEDSVKQSHDQKQEIIKRLEAELKQCRAERKRLLQKLQTGIAKDLRIKLNVEACKDLREINKIYLDSLKRLNSVTEIGPENFTRIMELNDRVMKICPEVFSAEPEQKIDLSLTESYLSPDIHESSEPSEPAGQGTRVKAQQWTCKVPGKRRKQ